MLVSGAKKLVWNKAQFRQRGASIVLGERLGIHSSILLCKRLLTFVDNNGQRNASLKERRVVFPSRKSMLSPLSPSCSHPLLLCLDLNWWAAVVLHALIKCSDCAG